MMVSQPTFAFSVGILGNLVSFMVYLAPVPTFYRVYKKKSTEGFQSVPYMVTLFSSMLWIYYALMKTNAFLIITINSLGSLIEITYIIMYLIYAPRRAKIFTARILFFLNVTVFGVILACTLLLAHGVKRTIILGWICVGFSVSVFVAPLSIMRRVIRTKSVEFMPFGLSFFLTVSASVWLCYGALSKDKFIALPNILGMAFGIVQMVIYCMYKDSKAEHCELPEHVKGAPTILAAGPEVHPFDGSESGGSGVPGEEKAREPTASGGGKENVREEHEVNVDIDQVV